MKKFVVLTEVYDDGYETPPHFDVYGEPPKVKKYGFQNVYINTDKIIKIVDDKHTVPYGNAGEVQVYKIIMENLINLFVVYDNHLHEFLQYEI